MTMNSKDSKRRISIPDETPIFHRNDYCFFLFLSNPFPTTIGATKNGISTERTRVMVVIGPFIDTIYVENMSARQTTTLLFLIILITDWTLFLFWGITLYPLGRRSMVRSAHRSMVRSAHRGMTHFVRR